MGQDPSYEVPATSCIYGTGSLVVAARGATGRGKTTVCVLNKTIRFFQAAIQTSQKQLEASNNVKP